MTSYIDSPAQIRRWGEIHPGHQWKAHTFDRLVQQYGTARAQSIMVGRDAATNADLAAWRNLGNRRAA